MTWRNRLTAGIAIDPETGCHLWRRARNTKGYGLLWADGRLILTHRLAWFATYGTWPRPGMVLDHLCNVPACCNVQHLRESTNGANIMRGIPRGDVATEHRRARWRQTQRVSRARRAES